MDEHTDLVELLAIQCNTVYYSDFFGAQTRFLFKFRNAKEKTSEFTCSKCKKDEFTRNLQATAA